MDYLKLIQQLKQKRFYNLYLFYGPEYFLIKEAITYIKNSVIPRGFRDVNFEKIDGQKCGAEEIINSCDTQPFFCDKRIVVVENLRYLSNNRKKDKQVEKISDYLKELNSSTILIFTSSKVDKRKALYKTIKKYGHPFEFKMLKGKALNKWVASRLSKLGKNISKEALQLFKSYPFANMEQLYNEIIKVSNFIGDRDTVEKADILKVIGPPLENNIFDLVDSIGNRDLNRAIGLMEDMLKLGQPEVFILFMIARQLKIMLQSKMLSKEGYSFNKIVSETGQHPFVIKKALQQGKNFETQQIKNMIKLCYELDVNIKTGRLKPQIAMEVLLTKIANIEESLP